MRKAMMRVVIGSTCVAALIASIGALAIDPPKPDASDKSTRSATTSPNSKQPRVLGWEDLIPPEERERPFFSSQRALPLFDDESGPAAAQEGSGAVNKSLDGQQVKLPGFIVPLTIDKDLRTSDFLLVPYFGACIHMPPPPPNQIVRVVMDKPFRLNSMYDPVWVIGTLSVEGFSSALASASYSLAGKSIELYQEEP